MKITFLNHSCFIVEHDNVKILCDPWLEGSVFVRGWKHLAPSPITYDDFKDIQYIWFSHEHPDHFFPPNLNKIPTEIRKNITILFHYTIDKRVVNYCTKAGYKEVVELQTNEYYSLAEDFRIMNDPYTEGDSWIVFKTKDQTILNTNDCGMRNLPEITAIKDKIGKVDVLLTQFSYAYWAGNRDEKPYRERIAKEKLDWLKFQCDVFKPAATIPIASYVYFCHQENFYLNDSINTAASTYKYIKENTSSEPVILHNGETYEYPNQHDSASSIAKFDADLKRIYDNQQDLEKTIPVALEDITKQANDYIQHLKESNNFIIKTLLKPTTIYLVDHQKCFSFSLADGFKEINLAPERCDVELASECLAFCFKFPYGLDSVQISGRFQKPKQGNYSRFYNIFRIDQLKSRGTDVGIKYLTEVALRKVRVKLGMEQV